MARIPQRMEMSTVRRNLLTKKNYTPYCGALCAKMPRTYFTGKQFKCSDCNWESSFEEEFIEKYKAK
jgi:hypothetical protein